MFQRIQPEKHGILTLLFMFVRLLSFVMKVVSGRGVFSLSFQPQVSIFCPNILSFIYYSALQSASVSALKLLCILVSFYVYFFTKVKRKPQLDNTILKTDFMQKLLQQRTRALSTELGQFPNTAWINADLQLRMWMEGNNVWKVIKGKHQKKGDSDVN